MIGAARRLGLVLLTWLAPLALAGCHLLPRAGRAAPENLPAGWRAMPSSGEPRRALDRRPPDAISRLHHP